MTIGNGRFDDRRDVYFVGENDDGVFFLSNDPRTPIDDTEVWVGCDPTNRLTVNEAENRYGTVYWRMEPELIHQVPRT